MKTQHYIIGDVHGNYLTLLNLLKKIPEKAIIIFVGDLIDRGPLSKEVVKLIREKKYQCILGNHEGFMIKYGEYLTSLMLEDGIMPRTSQFWLANGGLETLKSYGIIDGNDYGIDLIEENLSENINVLLSDIEWMKTLPRYIELDIEHKSGLPVVISHASIGSVWHMRKIESLKERFYTMCNTNRRNPDDTATIFNIFGHTIVSDDVDKQVNYVNVDTGCYYNRFGHNLLSCYCVETNESINEKRVDEDFWMDNF